MWTIRASTCWQLLVLILQLAISVNLCRSFSFGVPHQQQLKGTSVDRLRHCKSVNWMYKLVLYAWLLLVTAFCFVSFRYIDFRWNKTGLLPALLAVYGDWLRLVLFCAWSSMFSGRKYYATSANTQVLSVELDHLCRFQCLVHSRVVLQSLCLWLQSL